MWLTLLAGVLLGVLGTLAVSYVLLQKYVFSSGIGFRRPFSRQAMEAQHRSGGRGAEHARSLEDIFWKHYLRTPDAETAESLEELIARQHTDPGYNPEETCYWLNIIVQRIFQEYVTSTRWKRNAYESLSEVLNNLDLATLGAMTISDLYFGRSSPHFHRVKIVRTAPEVLGQCYFTYSGGFCMTIHTEIKFQWSNRELATLPCSMTVTLSYMSGRCTFVLPKGKDPVCRISFMPDNPAPKCQIDVDVVLGNQKKLNTIPKLESMLKEKFEEMLLSMLTADDGGVCWHLPISRFGPGTQWRKSRTRLMQFFKKAEPESCVARIPSILKFADVLAEIETRHNAAMRSKRDADTAASYTERKSPGGGGGVAAASVGGGGGGYNTMPPRKRTGSTTAGAAAAGAFERVKPSGGGVSTLFDGSDSAGGGTGNSSVEYDEDGADGDGGADDDDYIDIRYDDSVQSIDDPAELGFEERARTIETDTPVSTRRRRASGGKPADMTTLPRSSSDVPAGFKPVRWQEGGGGGGGADEWIDEQDRAFNSIVDQLEEKYASSLAGERTDSDRQRYAEAQRDARRQHSPTPSSREQQLMQGGAQEIQQQRQQQRQQQQQFGYGVSLPTDVLPERFKSMFRRRKNRQPPQTEELELEREAREAQRRQLEDGGWNM